MVSFSKNIFMVSASLLLVATVLGCPKKPTETASQSVSPTSPSSQSSTPSPMETAPPSEQHPVTEESVKTPEPPKQAIKAEGLKDIFFEFDRAAISPEMKSALDQDAAWLKANPKASIQLEGHCDERGTNEYNLALGEKRAHSVKQYLISQGIKASRLSTISYGEDRPFCKEPAESCYQQNRRVHFVSK
jgi:peptidoglycan-associated lipoprotein